MAQHLEDCQDHERNTAWPTRNRHNSIVAAQDWRESVWAVDKCLDLLPLLSLLYACQAPDESLPNIYEEGALV